jgi:hypothetical protein
MCDFIRTGEKDKELKKYGIDVELCMGNLFLTKDNCTIEYNVLSYYSNHVQYLIDDILDAFNHNKEYQRIQREKKLNAHINKMLDDDESDNTFENPNYNLNKDIIDFDYYPNHVEKMGKGKRNKKNKKNRSSHKEKKKLIREKLVEMNLLEPESCV